MNAKNASKALTSYSSLNFFWDQWIERNHTTTLGQGFISHFLHSSRKGEGFTPFRRKQQQKAVGNESSEKPHISDRRRFCQEENSAPSLSLSLAFLLHSSPRFSPSFLPTPCLLFLTKGINKKLPALTNINLRTSSTFVCRRGGGCGILSGAQSAH